MTQLDAHTTSHRKAQPRQALQWWRARSGLIRLLLLAAFMLSLVPRRAWAEDGRSEPAETHPAQRPEQPHPAVAATQAPPRDWAEAPRDWRMASEWDAGAKPGTRKMRYDDLYRLTRIEYQYPQGRYKLTAASNESTNAPHRGHLDAQYDRAGNLVALDVHREGPCLPTPGRCTNQHFEYQWDEIGRLVRARRWDMPNPPSGTPPDAELSYRYDASDHRVLKTVGARYTAYIFGSLELRSTTFDGDDVVDDDTETVYLQAHGVRLGRVVHSVRDPYELSTTRVYLELGDHLGSTSVVIDGASGEVVERATAYAYGATESDYRPARWGGFREAYRFTGKEEDIEVGLQYFGTRYYAPLLQRWISPDPLAVHAPGQGDLNLYAYVHGRVLVAVDLVGLCEPNQCCPSNAAAQLMSEGPSQATRDYAESVPGMGALQQKLDALPPPAPVQTQQGTAYPAAAQTTSTVESRTWGGIRYATDVDSGKAFKATGEKPIEATESPVDLIGPAIVVGGVKASAMLASRLLLSMPEVRLSIPVVGMSVGPGGGGGFPVRLRLGGVKPPNAAASSLTAGEAGQFASLDARGVVGDALTPHHMPQAALGFTSREEGGALVMTSSEHALTRTYSGKGVATARAEAGLPFRQVLARDIRDVRQLVGPKYDQGIRDLLQYYRTNFPELMAKPRRK